MNKKVKIPQQRYVKGHPGLKRSELEQLGFEYKVNIVPTKELEELKKMLMSGKKEKKS